MRSVFKISLPKDAEQIEERPFIPRKVHKKSRGGCIACKKRRIKCDETRPRCGKCVKTNSECVFSTSQGSTPKTLFVDERSPAPLTAEMYSMCIDAAETELGGLLSLTSGFDVSEIPTGNVQILQHFSNFTSLTLGGDACRATFHAVVARKAWDTMNPYLMHMVLAVSCAHLKRLHTDPSQMKLYQQYSLAEIAHWQNGLQLYQNLLRRGFHAAAGEPPPPDFDAALATTFLTIIFTFSLDDNIPVDAYAEADDEKFQHAINPLAATAGFRAMRDVFGVYMHDSCWRLVLMGSDDSKGTFSNSEQRGIDGLPAAFVDLCDIRPSSHADNNDYYHIVRLLAPLLRLDYDANHFTKLIAYCGRTWPNFRPLLNRRDPIAMLLLAYWFALLRQLNQWWLTQRARTECQAIVTYLAQLEDPKIDALLAFPASFGETSLDYLWNLPDPDSSPVAVFERYFSAVVDRKPFKHFATTESVEG